MKQKILIKVPLNGQKSRSKVMKIAVSVDGVESASLKGENMNQIEVMGEGIDSVGLTELLRKNLGYAELGLRSYLRKNEEYAELLSVTPVEKKEGGGGGGGGGGGEPVYPPIYWHGPYGYTYYGY